MKMFKFLVLISFFLDFTTTFVHAQDPDVVTDINGNELRSGARYFIVEPPPFAPTVPLAVGPDTPSCPDGGVVLGSKRVRPISITPVESNSTVILENTLVTVRFNYSYPCRMAISLVWAVGPGGFVTTGGVEGLNRFKLTKYEGGNNRYQLAACPPFECWGGCRCEPVSNIIVAIKRTRYLVAGGRPAPIVFVPVGERRIAYKLPSM